MLNSSLRTLVDVAGPQAQEQTDHYFTSANES